MDLVKKNLVSIICGVVAILAVAAIFWPVSGYYADLKTKATARGQVAASVNRILTNRSRKLPQLDLAPSADAKSLEVFPTRKVIDAWKGATDKFKDESAQIYKLAVDMNTHPLLVPGSLPAGSPAAVIDFRDLYKKEMDLQSPKTRNTSLAVRTLQAGFIPGPEQIAARRAEVDQKFRSDVGDPGSDPAFRAQLAQQLEAVPEQLKQEVRSQCKVYMESRALDAYSGITGLAGGSPEPNKIFIAQLGYWAQKDLLEAFAAANKDARNVEDAAVKHLIFIKISADSFKTMEQTAVNPAAPAPDANSWPQQPSFTTSLSGRATCGVYDVVKYDVEVLADAEQIPRILQELSRGRFITVLNLGIQSVDSGAKEARGFFYGDKPLVQLDLTCEELFLREWTKPYMPVTVRAALGIPPDQPKQQ